LGLLRTGIGELDRLLGGIPEGAIILLAGNPGTGKSSLAARFLYEGALNGEHVLYINFVEPKEDFYSHMKSLGMDFARLEEKGLLHYVEALTIIDEEALLAQLEEMARYVLEEGVKRVVVDSISVMLQIVGDKSRAREIIQNFFVNGLKKLGAATILIAEHPYGATMVGYGVEEFVVDGVIVLKMLTVKGKASRIMELRKARWASLIQVELPFEITPGKVIEVLVPEEPKTVPPPLTDRVYSFLDVARAVERKGRPPLSRVLTLKGEPAPLELVAPVYFLRGSQILIHLAEGVTSRFLTPLLAATLQHYTGEKVAILSFKTAPQILEKMLHCMYSVIAGSSPSDSVIVEAANPTAYLPSHMLSLIYSLVEEERPGIFFLEGIELIEEIHGEATEHLLVNTSLRLRREGVTTFYVYAADSAPEEKRLLRVLRAMADLKIDIEPLELKILEKDGRIVQRFKYNVKAPSAQISTIKEFVLNPFLERKCIY